MGKGTEILGKKIKFLKMRVGKNIKLQGTLYTPGYFSKTLIIIKTMSIKNIILLSCKKMVERFFLSKALSINFNSALFIAEHFNLECSEKLQ